MQLIDFNSSRKIQKFYGGNAGRKICIEGLDGEPWMLKFPESTAGMRGRVASYTTSPLSEWLGSHIYEEQGLPVHKTLLGFREGKIVCACKDFTYPDKTLTTFHDLKNSLSDDLEGMYANRPSDGRSLYLADILSAIEDFSASIDPALLRERFWDMFIIDTFIGNAVRNNENWGVLSRNGAITGLAPVYDNGNSFFSKRRESVLERRSQSQESLIQDAVGGAQSCYLKDDGHHINPLKYITSLADEQCNAALLRFMERLDMNQIRGLIEGLPEEFLNFTVMPEAAKEFHIGVLEQRIERYYSPAAAELCRMHEDISGRDAEEDSRQEDEGQERPEDPS